MIRVIILSSSQIEYMDSTACGKTVDGGQDGLALLNGSNTEVKPIRHVVSASIKMVTDLPLLMKYAHVPAGLLFVIGHARSVARHRGGDDVIAGKLLRLLLRDVFLDRSILNLRTTRQQDDGNEQDIQ